jgi:hypothetical protein
VRHRGIPRNFKSAGLFRVVAKQTLNNKNSAEISHGLKGPVAWYDMTTKSLKSAVRDSMRFNKIDSAGSSATKNVARLERCKYGGAEQHDEERVIALIS